MAGVTIVGSTGSDATEVAMLSGGEDTLDEVVSSSVRDPSDSRCFFDLGMDVLENPDEQHTPSMV